MTLQALENYGIGFQTKILSALLTDKEFLQNIHDILNEEDFNNSAQKWIVNETLQYYNKYNTYPTIDVLKVQMKKINNEILQIAIKDQIKEAYKLSNGTDLEYIKTEFTNFCKNQQMKKAIMDSVDFLKEGDFEKIRVAVDRALKAGQERDLGHEYEKDAETRYREDSRHPVPFPWIQFNEITQGGPGEGDLVIIFGNPKGGKSWVVIAMAAEAVKQGKNVIFYALELGEKYVGKRFDAYFTGIPVDQLSKNRALVDEVISKLPGKLIIKGYPPKKASLSTIRTHYNQVKTQGKLKDSNFEIHQVYIDYLDLLKNRSSRKERKDDIDDIYTESKGMAVELKVPIITPSQANRTGAEKEIIEGQHAAGSYDKIMIADILISLARGRKDRINGTGRFHFMGNRYGPDGVTYNAKIDTSTGHIEILELMDNDDIPTANEGEKSWGNKINNDEKDLLREKFNTIRNSIK